MAHRKEKTTVIIETLKHTRVQSRHREIIVWCNQCQIESVMVAPPEAAGLMNTTAREIFRKVETGEIHYLETQAGALLICSNSLLSENKKQ